MEFCLHYFQRKQIVPSNFTQLQLLFFFGSSRWSFALLLLLLLFRHDIPSLKLGWLECTSHECLKVNAHPLDLCGVVRANVGQGHPQIVLEGSRDGIGIIQEFQ
jgi:hypothetical protein